MVAIPRSIADDLGFKPGQKVIVEKDSSDDAVVIKKVTKTPFRGKKSPINKEFKKWWNTFLKENEGILDELAVR